MQQKFTSQNAKIQTLEHLSKNRKKSDYDKYLAIITYHLYKKL